MKELSPRASDSREDPLLGAAVLAVILAAVVFLLGLAVIYVGDEYVHPAWSERSVPPPRLD